jgi:hypothetical protein
MLRGIYVLSLLECDAATSLTLLYIPVRLFLLSFQAEEVAITYQEKELCSNPS